MRRHTRASHPAPHRALTPAEPLEPRCMLSAAPWQLPSQHDGSARAHEAFETHDFRLAESPAPMFNGLERMESPLRRDGQHLADGRGTSPSRTAEIRDIIVASPAMAGRETLFVIFQVQLRVSTPPLQLADLQAGQASVNSPLTNSITAKQASPSTSELIDVVADAPNISRASLTGAALQEPVGLPRAESTQLAAPPTSASTTVRLPAATTTGGEGEADTPRTDVSPTTPTATKTITSNLTTASLEQLAPVARLEGLLPARERIEESIHRQALQDADLAELIAASDDPEDDETGQVSVWLEISPTQRERDELSTDLFVASESTLTDEVLSAEVGRVAAPAQRSQPSQQNVEGPIEIDMTATEGLADLVAEAIARIAQPELNAVPANPVYLEHAAALDSIVNELAVQRGDAALQLLHIADDGTPWVQSIDLIDPSAAHEAPQN
ncbi:MAG: hypothetical protein KDB14_33155 [Planctomycetales bacterium]|nr:hypothetical protein [Planctomycetales bacterium]